MKFILTSAAVLSALFAQTQAQKLVSVSVDNTYDNPAGSTSNIACSDGPNGLVNGFAGRFPTFGSFPNFPNIGGSFAVAGFNSPNCGTCWNIQYEGKSINVLVIDAALNGFNITEAAFNELTNNQAGSIGRINNATAAQVGVSACGM